MLARIRNLLVLKRRFGWRRAMPVIALWTARQAVQYRKARVYRLDLASIPNLPQRAEFEWAFKERHEVEPSLIPDLHPGQRAASSTQRWFTGSCGGVPCYASAVSSQGFTVPDRITVTFTSPGAAYVGDCFTAERYRGRGVYPRGLTELGLRLRSEGKTDLYLFVELDNLASIGSVERAGFQPLADCSVWKVGHVCRRRWKFLKGAPLYLQAQWQATTVDKRQNQ